MLRFSIDVTCFRGVCLTVVRFVCEPTTLSRIEASHQRGKGSRSPRVIPAELMCQPFISDIILECGDGLGLGAVNDLVLLGEEPVPQFSG